MRLRSNRLLVVLWLPGYWQNRSFSIVTIVTRKKVGWVTACLVPFQGDNRCYRCNQDSAQQLNRSTAG